MQFFKQFSNCKTMLDCTNMATSLLNFINNSSININEKSNILNLFLKEIKNYYIENIIESNKKVLIISKKYPQFIMCHFFVSSKAEDMSSVKEICESLILFCKEYQFKRSGNRIKSYQVKNIMNTEKAYYLSLIIYYATFKPLIIINIPEKHCYYNSSALPNANIIINSVVDNAERNDVIYVFVHELGHILHMSITQDINIYPDGFTNMFELAFNNRIENVPIEDLKEIFADCFSIYYMFNTDFQSCNPFLKVFSYNSIKIINNFFDSLIMNALS